MGKKLGILTFHASYNCGSMLQAYALQKILKNKFNTDSEIIDFSNKEQKRMYSILYKPRNLKDFCRNCLNLFFYNKINSHNKDYIKFSKDNLIKSKESYHKLEELDEEKLEYDMYITGSDQVWNINAKDFDDTYFLPFVKKKSKIAYAVSLGATNINLSDGKEKFKKYINEFKDISVREKNAQKWIGQIYNKEVKICVDPTLLLSENEWEPIIGKREIKGKYILWYCMIYKKEIRKIIEKISKKYKMPVYVLDAKEWSRRGLFLHGIKLAKNGGPSSYLSLVKNAEMIITSSFHGSVFCSKFKKNFWYLNIHTHDTGDDRASFLLSQLNLKDRLVNKDEILKRDLLESPDYNRKSDIGKYIDESMEFLKKELD